MLFKKKSSAGLRPSVLYELRSVNLANLPEKEQGSVLDRFASFLDSLTEPITFHIFQDEREVEAIGALYQIPYKRFFLETHSQVDSLVQKLGTRMVRVHALPQIKPDTVHPKYIIDSEGRYIQTYCITRLGGTLVPGFLAELYQIAYCLMLDIEPIDIYEAKKMARSYARSVGSRLILRQNEGRSLDPEEQAEFQRASGAAQLIGAGKERLFRTRIRIVLRVNGYKELVEARKKLRQLVGGMVGQVDSPAHLQEALLTGVGPKYATGRWFFITTSGALSLFPFCGLDVVDPSGVFLGQNLQTGNAILYDVFEKENYNVAVMGSSVDYSEPLIYRQNGWIKQEPMGKVVDRYFADGQEGPFYTTSLEVVSFDPVTLKTSWTPLQYVFRHRYEGKLLKLRLQTGRDVTVTPNHSVFVLRDGTVPSVPASDIKKGDLVICARTVPEVTPKEYRQIDLLREYADFDRFIVYDVPESLFSEGLCQKLLATRGRTTASYFKRELHLPLGLISFVDSTKLDDVKIGSKGSPKYPRWLTLDEPLARLLGYYAAEGHLSGRNGQFYETAFTLDRNKDAGIVDDITAILRDKFGLSCRVVAHGGSQNSIRVRCHSKHLACLMKKLVGEGAATKKVPDILFNSPRA